MAFSGGMKMKRRTYDNEYYHAGFLSFDTLFSILPLLLIVFHVLQVSNFLFENADRNFETQHRFNRMVSIADYVVKKGAVYTEYTDTGEPLAVYPNWIDDSKLEGIDESELASEAGLDHVSITLDQPTNGTCIYRIVVTGQEKEIRQLFVCGG